MRVILGLLLIAAIGVGVFKYTQPKEPALSLVKQEAPAAATTQPEARQPHWPKASIDRATEVRQLVAKQRKSNDVP